MGRGRGKGKKQNVIAAREDTGSGEDDKLPSRRRGRPQKPLKDEIEDKDEVEKIEPEEDEEGKDTKSYIMNGSTETEDASENGRKRKRSSQVKENAENGMGTKTNNDDSIKFVGYRQNGSRRKNKPRRAAEVGVECK